MTKTMHSRLIRHPKFTVAAYIALYDKGHTNEEILSIWNRA